MKTPLRTTMSPDTANHPPRLGWRDLGIAVALAAVVAAIYAGVARHRFVYLDDDVYVFANEIVRRGLSRDGLVWAFTHFHTSNWHPLTWLSHMLDCQLFGVSPESAGFHLLVNVGLHAANAILLFLALRLMSGALWPAAFVAFLFAAHPLRVESVAWVSERKDVLSALFFMLTLLAYSRYAKRPRPAPYLLVLGTYLLGLLAKPMLVTVPFVLLLLDLWPLRRFSLGEPPAGRERRSPGRAQAPDPGALRRLLLEKIPLLVAALGVATTTFIAQRGGGSVVGLGSIPLPWRFVSATTGYVLYLWKTLWPSDLAALYIHPATLPGSRIESHVLASAAALLLLVLVTIAVLRRARREPYWVVGWLWYLGMLLPVIGLVQVGVQLWADRYAYLPLIGVYLMIAWGVRDRVARHPRARAAVAAVACAALVGYAAAARAQVAVWRDSRTLFEHTLRVTENNWVIENNLGAYLSLTDPASVAAQDHLEAAVRINAGFANAHLNLADVLFSQGSLAEARRHWEAALQLDPRLASAHVGVGRVLIKEGRFPEARGEFEEALRLDPKMSDAHANLGIVLARSGDSAARFQFEQALRLDPHSIAAQHLLARWLATDPDPRRRDPKRSLALARSAAEQSQFRRPDVLASLAAACAASGAYPQAVAWQRRALSLATETERPGYAERLRRYIAETPRNP